MKERQIKQLINELDTRKETSMDEDFNAGIDYAIGRLEELIKGDYNE